MLYSFCKSGLLVISIRLIPQSPNLSNQSTLFALLKSALNSTTQISLLQIFCENMIVEVSRNVYININFFIILIYLF